jgi:hypothetical protein
LEPEWWGSPLVQEEMYEEGKARDKIQNDNDNDKDQEEEEKGIVKLQCVTVMSVKQ